MFHFVTETMIFVVYAVSQQELEFNILAIKTGSGFGAGTKIFRV